MNPGAKWSIRTVPAQPEGIDLAELIRRGEAAFHCRRLRRWLRASLALNILLLAAVAGQLYHDLYSSSTHGAASTTTAAPIFQR